MKKFFELFFFQDNNFLLFLLFIGLELNCEDILKEILYYYMKNSTYVDIYFQYPDLLCLGCADDELVVKPSSISL